jgi:hypothetical protein
VRFRSHNSQDGLPKQAFGRLCHGRKFGVSAEAVTAINVVRAANDSIQLATKLTLFPDDLDALTLAALSMGGPFYQPLTILPHPEVLLDEAVPISRRVARTASGGFIG